MKFPPLASFAASTVSKDIKKWLWPETVDLFVGGSTNSLINQIDVVINPLQLLLDTSGLAYRELVNGGNWR